MKIFQTYFFIVFLLFSQNTLEAHNPQLSSIELTISDSKGLLELILSQYGVEQALMKKYPNLDLTSISTNDFKTTLIDYIKKSIVVSVDGKPLKIGSGVIKLGDHQTDLKFKIEGFPDEFQTLNAKANSFQENEKQLNFFTVLYKELKGRAKLTKKNNFKSEFTFSSDEIKASYPEIASKGFSKITYLGIAIGFLALFGVFFLIKRKK